MPDSVVHPNPPPLTDVRPAQVDQLVRDYYDAGATTVITTRQPNGSYTVTARFDNTSARPFSQLPGLLATASTEQTLARARSCLGMNTVYEMVPSDNDPTKPFSHRCDCSGFVDWSIGSWRQLPPQSDHWLYTDSIWYGGGEVGKGLFSEVRAEEATAGDFYVYPSPDSHHKGHIAVITAVDQGQPSQILHCSLSNYNDTNDAVRETDPHIFEANASSRIMRPNYDAIRAVARPAAMNDAGILIAAPSPLASLSWNDMQHPERKQLSAQLLASVNETIAELEKGNPAGFIPNYTALVPELRTKFWAELLIAMSKFESSWNPKDRFHESDGQWSIGLLQLSIGDQRIYNVKPAIQKEDDLEDPLINLQWGLQIFSHWLAKDGVVASGSDDNDGRGGARYWSVLRAGHKIDQIKASTKKNVGLAP